MIYNGSFSAVERKTPVICSSILLPFGLEFGKFKMGGFLVSYS